MATFRLIMFIVCAISFLVAVKIMSDIMSKRVVNKRKNIVISLALSTYSSLSIAFLANYYYVELNVLMFLVNTFSIFSIYIGISLIFGKIKIRRNERRKSTRNLLEHWQELKEFERYIESSNNKENDTEKNEKVQLRIIEGGNNTDIKDRKNEKKVHLRLIKGGRYANENKEKEKRGENTSKFIS